MTKGNIIFLWFSLSASLWSFSNFLLKLNPTTEILRLAYGLGMMLAALSLVWVYNFLGKKFHWSTKFIAFPLALIMMVISVYTDLVFEQLTSITYLGYEGIMGPLHGTYGTVLLYIVATGLRMLWLSYHAEIDQIKRRHIRYIFLGFSFFAGVSTIANFLIPYIWGTFAYVNFDDFSFLVFVFFILYAIIRYQLFDFKIVATELFVGTLWMFMVARVFLSADVGEMMIDAVIFIATVVFGILVIRSVLIEVRTREKMEQLARELAIANARLKDLDQQKSEFLSIASHQLRSPLTAIRGYSSMLLEDTFGPQTKQVDEALERIEVSSERLVVIIDDFLNISRIEQGRMKYNFEEVDLSELVQTVLREQEKNVERAGLVLKKEVLPPGPYTVERADYEKIQQVVSNIVDNAIKYTQKGSITIKVYRNDPEGLIHIDVSDTGIGIPPKVLPLLFQKFSRSKKAGSVNIQGTGLGLYVAKELMKAHKGKIWAESGGDNQGSTFHIALPIKSSGGANSLSS